MNYCKYAWGNGHTCILGDGHAGPHECLCAAFTVVPFTTTHRFAPL